MLDHVPQNEENIPASSVNFDLVVGRGRIHGLGCDTVRRLVDDGTRAKHESREKAKVEKGEDARRKLTG
jgi:hypothetical protein